MRTLLVAILFPLLMGAGTIPERALGVAGNYLHVREATNHNDHPDIDRFLAYMGLPKGLPWCAAFVVYTYGEAAREQQAKNPLPRYARVATLHSYAKANAGRYQVITPDRFIAGVEKIRPGDIPVWLYGAGPNPNGHTGLARGQNGRFELLTREGNTQPTNTGDQREGGGVYDRSRYLPNVKAIIRVRIP